MRITRHHQLFFIDSQTTHKTVTSDIALQENIRTASRDVFLDNDKLLYSTDKEFRRLLAMAKQRIIEIAIAIAITPPTPQP